MLHHLLVAHDLSPAADLALHHAARLAQREGAQLSVLHVLREQTRATAETYLHTQLAAYSALNPSIYYAEGSVVSAIQRLATGLPADLLIVGAHHTNARQPFTDTPLEHLLSACCTPVLLVTQDAVESWSTAVAAVDFSPAATRALQLAWALMADGGSVHAVQVHEIAHLHAHDDDAEVSFQKSLFDTLINDIRAQLPARAVQFAAHWLLGERQDCLQHFIQQQRPTVLALGIHNRSALSDVFVGSLWSEWLREPPCNLLLVHQTPDC